MKINELVEGVEYYIEGYPAKYRIKSGMLEASMKYDKSEWFKSEMYYNDAMSLNFTECEWTPKNDELYFVPSIANKDLFKSLKWCGDRIDLAYKRNVGVYRTKEKAIVKAKELGWT